jgi:hypothetical protein
MSKAHANVSITPYSCYTFEIVEVSKARMKANANYMYVNYLCVIFNPCIFGFPTKI